jgi:hypothetical protein
LSLGLYPSFFCETDLLISNQKSAGLSLNAIKEKL